MSGFISFQRRPLLAGLLACAAGPCLGGPLWAGGTAKTFKEPWPWAVVYSEQWPRETKHDYRLIVLDSEYHPSLRRLRRNGAQLLGYISLGEVETYRPHFQEAKAAGLLGDINPNWPDSHYVDLRNQQWTTMVLEKLIPKILTRGFDGIIIDTLDNAGFLEYQSPDKTQGMTEAAAALVQAIGETFPGMPIMLNRAYEILPQVDGVITYALGESVRSGYDFEAKRPALTTDEDYNWQCSKLWALQERAPQVKVVTLDYWPLDDLAGISELYRLQRGNGFLPYVSSVSLDRLVEEPM